MNNVVLKNITDRADKAFILWDKTRNKKYKELWCNIMKEAEGGKNTSVADTIIRWDFNKERNKFSA